MVEDLACSIQAIEIRHADVENDDIWLQPLYLLHGGTPIRSFAAHSPSIVHPQQFGDSPPYNLVVVRDEDSQLAHRISPRGAPKRAKALMWLPLTAVDEKCSRARKVP